MIVIINILLTLIQSINQIKITIDGDVIEKTHDQDGIVTLNGNFKSNLSEEKIQIQIDISSGEGENTLANTNLKELTKNASNSRLYELNDQIIYKPNLPKEAHLIGRVVDSTGQAIPNAKLTVSIFFPVFQDYLTAFTDNNGQFNVVMSVEQLNPIYGDLTIEAEGYKIWNIKKDSLYTQGFYLLNHLQFQFKEDIVLKKGLISLELQGTVIEHKINKPYAGSTLSLVCQGLQNTEAKTFSVGPTIADGKFLFTNSNTFDSEEKITCKITAKPKDSSLYEATLVVEFLRSEQYKVNPVTIYITTKPIIGYIKGKFVSEANGEAIPDLSLEYIITSEIKINVQPIKTNALGEFTFNLIGYESESQYEGYLAIKSDMYDTSIHYPATIKEVDTYSLDLGVLKAKQKPKPVTINIQGILMEKTLKLALPNFDLSIIITFSDNKVNTIKSKSDGEGKFSYSFEGQNTENYTVEIKTEANEKFQELNEGNKRELGANKAFKFDGNFKELLIQRFQTFGKVTGYLYDASTNKPIDQGRITILTDLLLPDQDIKCSISSTGNFRCDFVVEKFLTYQATVQVTTEYGMTGKVLAGELSMQNNYTIIGLRGAVKFEIVPQKGIISGQVINGETNQIITEGFYKIITIDPQIDNQESILNKEVAYGAEGAFKIELDLHVGPKYTITVVFTSPILIQNQQIFELNYKNKYTLDNLKILLGIPLNGEINGHIKSKLFFPIKDALVKVFVENIASPFTCLTDGKGYYKIKIPAASTQDIVKAKIQVERVRFQLYSEDIQFEKKSNFINENHEIILSSEKWKSTISGKIIDENNLAIPFCSLSLVLKDSYKEPTTVLPYTTVSVLSGDYIFTIEVTYDDVYMSYFSIKCNFFIDRKELFELNNQNEYAIQNRISKMERQHIQLDFSGTVLNSLNKPVPDTGINILYDYDSHSHGVVDQGEVNINGKFEFKQTVLMGYIYRAKAEIKLPSTAIDADYENFNLDLEFNPSNNYKIYQDIEIKKKLVDCQISGQILDASTKQPIQNGQAILHFIQREFSEQTVFVYTDDKGSFTIKTQIQEGFNYQAKAEGKCKGYKDGSVDINLTQGSKGNQYTISDIQILLTQAGESDYTQGFIHGHALSIIGEALPNSSVQAYCQVDPSAKYSVSTDVNGWFQLPDFRLIKGNSYAFIVELTPSDANFNKKVRKIHLTENDDYQYNNLTLAADRTRVNYVIKGKITDQNSGLVLGGTYVTVSFINQLMIQNAYAYTNKDGDFTLTGTVAKGLNYDGKFVIIHAGYETLTPQFTFQYTASTEEVPQNYFKNDAQFSLVMNPFQKLYYVDERNIVPIRSKVYERTNCRLYPNKYLPFVKVSLYIEKQQGKEGTLIAETYTDLKGNFKIDAPRPLFSDLQTYIVYERRGYMQLKEYQRITPSASYVEQGPQQINNQQGVSNCSKRQRKIQDKFDKS